VRRTLAALATASALMCGCPDRPAPPLSALTPKKLAPLDSPGDGGGEDRESAYRVEPAPVFGDPSPPGGVTLGLVGTRVKLGSDALDASQPADLARLKAAVGNRPVLLVPDPDTYLAQVSELLAFLDDGQVETWILHPSGQVAFPVKLRDEAAFQAWLDAPNPGDVRIIQRADGLEIQTNLGKLAGADPKGPTVPVRGGELDIARLRHALGRLKERFQDAADVCLVPSFGTELVRASAVLSGNYTAPKERIFGQLCLVYPRISKPDH
jgi:hypothetical protein